MTTLKILIALTLTTLIAILTNVISGYVQESKPGKNKGLIVILFLLTSIIGAFTISNPSVWENLWKSDSKNEPENNHFAKIDTTQSIIDTPVLKTQTEKKEVFENSTTDEKLSTQINTKQLTVKDTEGNSYEVVRIGNLTWLAENMKISVPDAEMNFADTSDARKFGKFYSFDGAKKACATLGKGWRLPSVTEFQSLCLQNDGGYTQYRTFGKNEAIGNPQNAYINNIEGGKSGFNSLLSGYGFGTTNKIVYLSLKAKYWATNITGNPDQIESNKKYYFYSFTFDKNLKEITQFEYFDWGISEYNSCRCVTELNLSK